jgi:soluble lytic murein transglycosylase
LAAYNAGPARANRWIKRNGDPRDKNVDAIDWVEMIPFNETRNYVQRVIENLHVYRKRLNQTEIAFNPEGDLQR